VGHAVLQPLLASGKHAFGIQIALGQKGIKQLPNSNLPKSVVSIFEQQQPNMVVRC
jgi:hypothetical protein